MNRLSKTSAGYGLSAWEPVAHEGRPFCHTDLCHHRQLYRALHWGSVVSTLQRGRKPAIHAVVCVRNLTPALVRCVFSCQRQHPRCSLSTDIAPLSGGAARAGGPRAALAGRASAERRTRRRAGCAADGAGTLPAAVHAAVRGRCSHGNMPTALASTRSSVAGTKGLSVRESVSMIIIIGTTKVQTTQKRPAF